MMITGQRLGLVLLYVVLAGYAVLMLRIFVQILLTGQLKSIDDDSSLKRMVERPTLTARFSENAVGPTHGCREILKSISLRKTTIRLANSLVLHRSLSKFSHWFPSLLHFGLPCTVAAQQCSGREVSVSTLKQQLLDLELKETRIRMRLEELNEQLKPESIERDLTGIGSVHPEELREHRRKLLTIERNGFQTQLDLLEEDRARIEAAIATAGPAASLEYTQPSPSPLLVTASGKPMTEMISLRDLRIAELPLRKLNVAVGMLALLGSGFVLLVIGATQKVQRWIVFVKSGSGALQTNGNCSSDPLTPTEVPLLKSTQGMQS